MPQRLQPTPTTATQRPSAHLEKGDCPDIGHPLGTRLRDNSSAEYPSLFSLPSPAPAAL